VHANRCFSIQRFRLSAHFAYPGLLNVYTAVGAKIRPVIDVKFYRIFALSRQNLTPLTVLRMLEEFHSDRELKN
jgi:hypothetical protein